MESWSESAEVEEWHDRHVADVLLTGSEGKVGQVTRRSLEAEGWVVRGFDLAGGRDLRDEHAVREAMAGCTAVVHAGALAHDSAGSPADVVATNVLGTWHVLLAAEAALVRRVVYLSSAQVFGCAEGEGEPTYLPIDDSHPLRAARPYGMSKRLAEEMCDAWSARTEVPSIVLRPVMVLSDEELLGFNEAGAEFGAYVHVDDVAEAVCLALRVDIGRHIRLTLCGPGSFDTSLARDVLGWHPFHDRWPSDSQK